MNLTGDLNDPDLNLSKVLILVGPTAVGKSEVALIVADRLRGEIVALDSRQIYRYMAIGTVQPSHTDRRGIPHHLYGIREPRQRISSGEYANLVEERTDEILSRGNQPIVCGGSGLYYRALTKGLFEGSTTDLSIRQKLTVELKEKGAAVLLERLQKIDPEYARIVHPHNHKRLLRALEIHQVTGIPLTEHFQKQKNKLSGYRLFTIYMKARIPYLEERIRKRTEDMLKAGWIEETRGLLDRGYTRHDHPMDSLGYRQILEHLDGKIRSDELPEKINIRTRQYAKKQLKWFNREAVDLSLDIDEKSTAESLATVIIEQFESL